MLGKYHIAFLPLVLFLPFSFSSAFLFLMVNTFFRTGSWAASYVGDFYQTNDCGFNMMVWRGEGLDMNGFCDQDMAQLLIDVSVAKGGSPDVVRDEISEGIRQSKVVLLIYSSILLRG